MRADSPKPAGLQNTPVDDKHCDGTLAQTDHRATAFSSQHLLASRLFSFRFYSLIPTIKLYLRTRFPPEPFHHPISDAQKNCCTVIGTRRYYFNVQALRYYDHTHPLVFQMKPISVNPKYGFMNSHYTCEIMGYV